MKLRDISTDEVEIVGRDGKTFVKVPRGRVNALLQRLRTHAIGATTHIDPYQSHWLVEPWTNLSPEHLRTLLAGSVLPTPTS